MNDCDQMLVPPMMQDKAVGSHQDYLQELLQEKHNLEHSGTPNFNLAQRLIDQEIEKLQTLGRTSMKEDRKYVDVIKDKPIRVTIKVMVPVRDHPKFNFVGKLLGPKGNSLKRLQEETLTKMAILGKGSMRDKDKEEQLRALEDPRYSHLHEDLHVEITTFAPPAEAHARIAYALTEIRRFLIPDYNDEIRQEQMREMQLINGNASSVVEDPASPKSPGLEDQITNGEDAIKNTTQELHPALRDFASFPDVNLFLPTPELGSRGSSVLSRLRVPPGLVRIPPPPPKRNTLSLINKARNVLLNECSPDLYELPCNFDVPPSFGLFEGIPNIHVASFLYDPANNAEQGLVFDLSKDHLSPLKAGSLITEGPRFQPYPRFAHRTINS